MCAGPSHKPSLSLGSVPFGKQEAGRAARALTLEERFQRKAEEEKTLGPEQQGPGRPVRVIWAQET